MPHGPNMPPAANQPPQGPDTLGLAAGYYGGAPGTPNQAPGVGLPGGQAGQGQGPNAAPITGRGGRPRLYGGLDGASASLGAEGDDLNFASQQHLLGLPKVDTAAAFALAPKSAAYHADLTSGNNRNVATRLPGESGFTGVRRGDIHLPYLLPFWQPHLQVPYKMLGWRYRGDESRGVTHAVLDRTIGTPTGPVVPKPLRAFHRMPLEIARDTSLTRTERIAGATAMGLAGVVVAPVSALAIGARALFRNMRER